MRKAIAFIFVVWVSALCLSACGGSGDGTIRLYVLNYVDPSEAEAQEEMWAAFKEAHPNIMVIREDRFGESYHNAVSAHTIAGTLPDVIFAWPSGRSAALHTNNLLLDLEPLVQRDRLDNQLTAAVLNPSWQVGGFLGIIPQGFTATHTFIVNLEVLNQVGLTPALTYSELVAQVPILREAGFDTVVMPNLPTWVMHSCLFSLVVGRFMGTDWDARMFAGEIDFTDPQFIAALDFIKSMYADGVLPRESLAIDYNEGPAFFAANQGAYYIDSILRLNELFGGDLSEDEPEENEEALISPERRENFIVTVFPEIDLPDVIIPGGTNSVILNPGWGINADLEENEVKLEAAWTLVKWLSGREPINQDFDIATPAIEDVFDSVVYDEIIDGLHKISLGIRTPEEVARITQAAFESWGILNP